MDGELLDAYSNAVADAAEMVSPSVVNVKTVKQDGEGNGSGFILTPDGFILTNDHVVRGCFASRIAVTCGHGRTVPAELIGRCSQYDLAVIRVAERNLAAVKLGDSDKLRVGQIAIGIGHPIGLDTTVTAGIISGLHRSVAGCTDLIQTDAALNPGNSGGPLVDSKGRVIGISTLVLRGNPLLGASFEGLNFAIGINTAKQLAGKLIARGGQSS